MARAPKQELRCQYRRGHPDQCKRKRQVDENGKMAKRCWQHRVEKNKTLSRTSRVTPLPTGRGLYKTKRMTPAEAQFYMFQLRQADSD